MSLFGSIMGIAAPILGGLISGDNQEDANRQNAETQREFAQHGIRWKVADALAAGLHPLAALGSSTATFSPSFQSDSGLGRGIAEAGQSIGRAVDDSLTADDRQQKRVLNNLLLEKAGLENDLLRSQISTVNRTSTPPFPSGSISGDVEYNPSAITSSHPANSGNVAGTPQPAAMHIRNSDGSTSVVPSKDVAESLEAGGEIVGGIMSADWFHRNRIQPWFNRQFEDAGRAWQKTWWNPNRIRR